jgi:DNA polymerase III subunit epsilon
MLRPSPAPATPLHEVDFCVVDLETTGGSPIDDAITEVGAVRVRAGELLGSFASLVDPGLDIPPAITLLTGITDAMVCDAPTVEPVLAAFTEFASGSVLVGHNVSFDLAFLRAACQRAGYPPFEQPVIDTKLLARRLLGDEVPDRRLGTLAYGLRLEHRPSHRALDDALATVELLHVLLERCGGLGVCDLDDLLAVPATMGRGHDAKLRLMARLPRRPGVHVVSDARGQVVHVDSALDLRASMRAWFAGDGGRVANQVLRVMAAIDHVETADLDAARVVAADLVDAHRPRFNRPADRRRGIPRDPAVNDAAGPATS